MKVSADVIRDLAPLYLSGDASADTRALVREALAADPELARWMEQQGASFQVPAAAAPSSDLEVRTLRRVRGRVAAQHWLFGLGCSFLALLLSSEFTTRGARIVEFHLLARDHPLAAAIGLTLAGACFIAHALLRRGTP